ncbi:hypothetical protein QBC43DRAFT_293521 [Cladorrhinum sp. PSN259]|nr:hypothetical protein QBC43DRAFT_293521 [Cladorrhinum sp. PSN259]
MRLLDTSTLRLVHKREGDVPPYAILSHTWGDDNDEVSFSDIQELSNSRLRKNESYPFKHPVTKKPGFAKIRDSARLAKSEGYDYIWIDTCCIDKTSSAELSEAINSMFRWYNEAAVCYAFLSDVEDSYYTTVQDDTAYLRTTKWMKGGNNLYQKSKTESSIESSRWFRRGWTLQELIAPANVYFYSNSWTLLGNKLDEGPSGPSSGSGFTELLSSLTGVDVGVLTGSLVLEDLSVASRMKWAARRQTTRTEDIAYCLMGIFNVNMPLLYGEGTRAFMRLQEEILKVTHDHSIFCWECGENDMLRYQLSGLLALSPTYFENFGDIRPVPFEASRFSQGQASAPSTMTNAGLHVQLSLLDLSPDIHSYPGHAEPEREWYAVLDCIPHDYREHKIMCPAIRLVALGGDQYARLHAEEIFWVEKIQAQKSERKYIYVKQVPMYGLPDIYIPDHAYSSSSAAQSTFCTLTGVYPQSRWSPQTRTLKPDTSRHHSVLGIFRYAVGNFGDSESCIIEVSVGIQPGQQGSLSWNCWCYIQGIQRNSKDQWLPVPGLAKLTGGSRHKSDRLTYGSGSSIVPILRQDQNVRFTDRFVFQNISATVKTTRLRNKTYLSLIVSEIHELHGSLNDPNPQSLAQPGLHVNIFELESDQHSFVEGNLAVLAASLTTSDEWWGSLGLQSEETFINRPGPSPIRTGLSSKDSADGTIPVATRQTLEEVLAEATTLASGLVIDGSDGSEGNVIEDYFSLLLAKACMRNDLDAVSQFINSPLSTANLEARTSLYPHLEQAPWYAIFKGFRALHWATALGHTDIVRLLLNHEADASSSTSSGLSAVHLAAMAGHAEILSLILDATDHLGPQWYNTHRRADSPAHLAAAYGKGNNHLHHILDRLMFPTKPATKNRESILAHMSEGGFKDEDPEYFASEEGHYADVEQEWADVTYNKLNSSRETPLHRAAAMDNFAAAEIILGYNHEGFYPLSAKDSFGRTPLWHAAAAGSVDIVRLFLDHGAHTEFQDSLGRTALHAACREGHWAVVESLLTGGASVRAVTEEPLFTACHFAALGGNPDIIRTLVKHQFTTPLSTTLTLSPIHIAAANGFAKCVRVLCEAGHDVEMKATHRLLVNAPHSSLGVLVTTVNNGTPEQLALYGSYFKLASYIRSVQEDRARLQSSFASLSLGLEPGRPAEEHRFISRPLSWEIPATVFENDPNDESDDAVREETPFSEDVSPVQLSQYLLPAPAQDSESFSATMFPFFNGQSDGDETPRNRMSSS